MPSLKNSKCPISANTNPLMMKKSQGKKVLNRINSPPKQPKCKNKKKKLFISPALVGMKLAPERLRFQKHFHFH